MRSHCGRNAPECPAMPQRAQWRCVGRERKDTIANRERRLETLRRNGENSVRNSPMGSIRYGVADVTLTGGVARNGELSLRSFAGTPPLICKGRDLEMTQERILKLSICAV